MGIARFILRHGPGSPGSVAKAMAKWYTRITSARPDLTHEQVLYATLRSRYPEQKLGEDALQQMLAESKGDLATLSMLVVHFGNAAANESMLTLPDIYAQAIEIVRDVTAAHAPAAATESMGPTGATVDDHGGMIEMTAAGFVKPVRDTEDSEDVIRRLSVPTNLEEDGRLQLLAIRLAGISLALANARTHLKEDIRAEFKSQLVQSDLNDDADTFERVVETTKEYVSATKEGHENGPGWSVGKLFARSLGHEMDLDYIMASSFVFTNTHDMSQRVLEMV